jgi:hypothetical protein
MTGNEVHHFVSPKTIEEMLMAVALQDNPPPNTVVEIVMMAELMTDMCMRIRELENRNA